MCNEQNESIPHCDNFMSEGRAWTMNGVGRCARTYRRFGGPIDAEIDWSSMWKSPAAPSAQSPTAPMSDRCLAVGQTSGCAASHGVVGSPVAALHLFEKFENGM
jgi:hypothetical protein